MESFEKRGNFLKKPPFIKTLNFLAIAVHNSELYVTPRVPISLPQDEYSRPLVPVRLGRVPERRGQCSQPK
jgi:hypothetical protein